jgi:hypothetical protein
MLIMKTIQAISKRLALIAVMLCSLGTGPAVAQNYYTPGTTIRGNGFTYICEEDPGSDPRMGGFGGIRVRNANNTLTYRPPMRNGQTLPLLGNPQTIVKGKRLHYGTVCNIASAIMTPTDRQNAINEALMIEIRINPRTGRIWEIEFVMDPYKNGFVRVAPEKLFQLETALKQQALYELTAAGQSQNFVNSFIPFRGKDIGQTYDFATGVWREPIPPLSAPTIQVDRAQVWAEFHPRFTVLNPLPGATYEWELDGAPLPGYGAAPAAVSIRPVAIPPAASSATFSVRCRARYNGRVSDWSNTLTVRVVRNFGIDFTVTNNSFYDIDELFVWLTGYTGSQFHDFIDCQAGAVTQGSSKGLPDYPGVNIVAEPGTPISELTLNIMATSSNGYDLPKNVRINAWIGGTGGSPRSELHDLNRSDPAIFELTEPLSVPDHGRLMLHIEINDYYQMWRAPAPTRLPTSR